MKKIARIAAKGWTGSAGMGAWTVLLFAVFFHSPSTAEGPKGYDPVLRIPMETLGFQPPASRVQALGGTVVTLHFVDDQHLLFTYYARKLMRRLPDALPEDDDGIVAALLLELPTGRVLARTEWRTRDRDQYLWPIGHGRFLLRIRTKLTLLNPMGQLARGDAFREEPFADYKRRIGYITTSPGGDLLTIETVPPPKPKLVGGAASAAAFAAAQSGGRPTEPEPEARKAEVQVFFYRLLIEKIPGEPERLIRRHAGMLNASNLVDVPVNAQGYLSIAKESSRVYLFDFQPHIGKRIELSPYETTCLPHPYFVSRSDFVAFGCHGAVDKPQLGGFNLQGEHAWIEVLSGAHVTHSIVAAPASGRFALSRALRFGAAIDPMNVAQEEITGQEITVRQNYDGHLLLKVQANPIQQNGQNFDLSPNGLLLTATFSGNIEVYRLPSLSAKDQQELKQAAAMELQFNEGMVSFSPVPAGPRTPGGESGASQTANDAPNADPDTGVSTAGAKPVGAIRAGANSAELPGGSAAGDNRSAAAQVTRDDAADKGKAGSARPAATPAPTAPLIENQTPAGDEPTGHRRPPTLYDADHPKPHTP